MKRWTEERHPVSGHRCKREPDVGVPRQGRRRSQRLLPSSPERTSEYPCRRGTRVRVHGVGGGSSPKLGSAPSAIGGESGCGEEATGRSRYGRRPQRTLRKTLDAVDEELPFDAMNELVLCPDVIIQGSPNRDEVNPQEATPEVFMPRRRAVSKLILRDDSVVRVADDCGERPYFECHVPERYVVPGVEVPERLRPPPRVVVGPMRNVHSSSSEEGRIDAEPTRLRTWTKTALWSGRIIVSLPDGGLVCRVQFETVWFGQSQFETQLLIEATPDRWSSKGARFVISTTSEPAREHLRGTVRLAERHNGLGLFYSSTTCPVVASEPTPAIVRKSSLVAISSS